MRALSILVRYSSSTAPLSDETILGLREAMCFFHQEVDPRARNEFINLAKNLVRRVVGVLRSCSKSFQICKSALSVDAEEMISDANTDQLQKAKLLQRTSQEIQEKHVMFLKLYLGFLAKELQPTASYQRHITALFILHDTLCLLLSKDPTLLQTIELLGDIGDWTGTRGYTQSLVRPLFDLIMDPFEDVRSAASSLLHIILRDLKKSQPDQLNKAQTSCLAVATEQKEDACLGLSGVLAHSLSILRSTSRADHADGVARLYSLFWQLSGSAEWHDGRTVLLQDLLSRLQKDTKVAQSDLHVAIRTRPLHGHLIALRSGMAFRDASWLIVC